jgi:hypothetical protein
MVPAPAGATAMMRAVAREQHQRPSRGRTDRAATGPALSLITGLPDDRREPLEPHHSLYRMASRLRRTKTGSTTASTVSGSSSPSTRGRDCEAPTPYARRRLSGRACCSARAGGRETLPRS